MYRLEGWLKILFRVFFLAIIFFWFSRIYVVFAEDFSVINYGFLFLSSLAICLMVATLVFRVPAAYVAVVESLITGRFLPDSENECGCSVPIRESVEEGLHLKWPWHKRHLFSREIRSLLIEDQRYDIKRGAVVLSGVVQYTISLITTYRVLAISKEDIERGMSAVIDQVLVSMLIQASLEEALQLKSNLREGILEAFNKQAEVEVEVKEIEEGGSVRIRKKIIPRTLFGKPVSVAEHRYAIQITDINIDQIDPVPELQAARSAVQVEELKIAQAEEKMKRFSKITKELREILPHLSDEQIGEKLELIEGLSTKVKNLYGFSDLKETGTVVAGLVELFKASKKE